jgi:hypothetical protein
MPLPPAEDLTIRAFVVRERRDRFLELLAGPKHRKKITDSLAHPHPAWFYSRFVSQIPPSQSNAASIAKLLRVKGAGRTCWVISEDKEIDARKLDLDTILAQVVGYGMGAILCCVPGRLAFVESEDGRFILRQ